MVKRNQYSSLFAHRGYGKKERMRADVEACKLVSSTGVRRLKAARPVSKRVAPEPGAPQIGFESRDS